jgi:hypothetical protein
VYRRLAEAVSDFHRAGDEISISDTPVDVPESAQAAAATTLRPGTRYQISDIMNTSATLS